MNALRLPARLLPRARLRGRLALRLAGAALLLSGCAGLPEYGTPGTVPLLFSKPSDQVSFPRGEAFKTYADVRVSAALHLHELNRLCAGKGEPVCPGQPKAKVPKPEVCAGLIQKQQELERLDRKIMNALANPPVAVDWEAIGEAVKIIMTVATAAAAL